MKKSAYQEIQKKIKDKSPLTLKEVLNVMNDTDTMAIGSNSSFFFMGTREEFKKDLFYLEKYYETFRIKALKRLYERKCIEKYTRVLAEKQLLRTKELEEQGIKRKPQPILTPKLEEVPEPIKEEVKEKFETYRKQARIPKDFIPFLDRQVINLYIKRLADEPKFAVIIEGADSGRCWLQKDYKPFLQEISRRVYM